MTVNRRFSLKHDAIVGIMAPALALLSLCVLALISCVAAKESSDVAYTAGGFPYSRRAYEIGRAEAEKDIKAGRLIIECYGFPPKGYDRYLKNLQKRYKIKVRSFGDVLDEDLIGHAMGYNGVSKAEIKRRFGVSVLSEAAFLEIANRKKGSV
jgi:hypothetical protein